MYRNSLSTAIWQKQPIAVDGMKHEWSRWSELKLEMRWQNGVTWLEAVRSNLYANSKIYMYVCALQYLLNALLSVIVL